MDPTPVVKEIITSITGISAEQIASDSNLYLDVGVASVHALQLLTELERRFNIAIPDEEFVEATSLNSLAALIRRLTSDNCNVPPEPPHA
jgi:acyl carrier protein